MQIIEIARIERQTGASLSMMNLLDPHPGGIDAEIRAHLGTRERLRRPSDR
jgi:hypothetical protein